MIVEQLLHRLEDLETRVQVLESAAIKRSDGTIAVSPATQLEDGALTAPNFIATSEPQMLGAGPASIRARTQRETPLL